MNRKERRQHKKSEAGPAKPMPPSVQAIFAEAVRRHQAGQLAEADSLYRQVLAVESSHAESLYLRGIIAGEVGRNDVAVDLIAMAIKVNAKAAPFHFSLAASFRAIGRLDEAIASFRRGLDLEPNAAEAHNELGITLARQGLLEEAIASFGQACNLKRDYVNAHLNKGLALHGLTRREQAEAAFRKVIALDPQNAMAHNSLGATLKSLGKMDEAISAFRTAITLSPNYAAAYFNLGNALHDRVHLDAAVASYQKAIALHPGYAEAHNNLAIALKDAWLLDEAALCYRTALDLNPTRAEAHSAHLAFLHYRSEISQDHILAESRRFGEQFDRVPKVERVAVAADPERRLRIGYVSGDFRRHPVADFLIPVLNHRDPNAVETFCYSNNARSDDMTERLKSVSDHWRSLAGLSDELAAKMISSDAIDILVDLAGHTALNRLTLFAGKPAPIQTSWLGYWGTTGLAAMDYLLSDAVTLPPDAERFYSEKIVRLPSGRFCYAPPDYAPSPAPHSPMCQSGQVTFGSFNNPDKLTRDVIGVWAAVLRAVPQSRLLLKWATLADEGVRRRLSEAFAAEGIGSERLLLREKSPHAEMLTEYGDIDIALDPFPFSGGLTSCEALWMGVPVLTLPGDRAASRQTLGFLQALDSTEWAAASPADYVKIATTLAADGQRLSAIRQTLRQRMANSSLCDGPTFTRDLEAVYRKLWRQWCADFAGEKGWNRGPSSFPLASV